MKTKRIAVLLLSLLLLGLLPWNEARADAGTGGTLGETVTWELKDGTLTISGEGKMEGLSTSRYPKWYYLRNEITKVVVEEGIVNIGALAFKDCENLKEVHLPSTLKTMDAQCFENCRSLEEISIPSKVTTIQYAAFKGCRSLKSFTMPNSVNNLGDSILEDCEGLETVTLSNKLERVTERMFEGCKSLKKVTLPKSVTRIDSCAFQFCTSLTTVEFKGKIIFIRDFAFYQCRSLISLEFPASLEWFGDYVFQDCPSLMELRFKGDMPDMFGYDVFKLLGHYDGNRCVIYYPVNNKTWTKEKMDRFSYNQYIRFEPYGTPECDHKNETIPGKEATCTEEGLTEGKRCTICGKVTKKQETIPMTAHSFATVTIPPTCMEGGFDLTVCSLCGLEERSNLTAPMGHTLGDWETIRAATTDEMGLEARQCLRCPVKEERLTQKLPLPPTEPAPTEPRPTVPEPTTPKETAPEPGEPEPAQRRDAGLAILGILAALAAVIFVVRRLYRKRT